MLHGPLILHDANAPQIKPTPFFRVKVHQSRKCNTTLCDFVVTTSLNLNFVLSIKKVNISSNDWNNRNVSNHYRYPLCEKSLRYETTRGGHTFTGGTLY